MDLKTAIDRAIKKGFGPTAIGILYAASRGPVNPWDYFGTSLRRSWSYAYFKRLYYADLIEIVDPPEGRLGHHWYVLA